MQCSEETDVRTERGSLCLQWKCTCVEFITLTGKGAGSVDFASKAHSKRSRSENKYPVCAVHLLKLNIKAAVQGITC